MRFVGSNPHLGIKFVQHYFRPFRGRCDKARRRRNPVHGAHEVDATQVANTARRSFALMAIFGWRSSRRGTTRVQQIKKLLAVLDALSWTRCLGQGANRIRRTFDSNTKARQKPTLGL
jgi:hypothetical protein